MDTPIYHSHSIMEDVVKYVLTLFLLLCDVSSSHNGTKSPPLDRTHNQEFHPKPSRFTRIKLSDQIHPSIDGLSMASNIVHSIQQANIRFIDLLIIVESSPFSWAWREGIRKTWGGGAIVNTQGHTHFIVFVVPIERHQIGNRLLQEINEYRDIILFKLVSPSTTSSVRVINYLHWCNQLFNYNYLVRTTDSYYIRVAGLITKLSSFEPNNLLYMGYFKGNASVDKTDNKWFVCPRLVPHADEGTYVLSKSLAERFVKHAKYLSYYQSEGASIGLWISPFKNVKLVHDIDFDSLDSRGCWNTLLMTQETSIEGMKARHDRVINGAGSFCEKEISITGNYQYNWHNPPSQCCKILLI